MEDTSIYIGYFLTGILGLSLCFLVLYSLGPHRKEIVQNNDDDIQEQVEPVTQEHAHEPAQGHRLRGLDPEERLNELPINPNDNIDINDFDLGLDENDMLQADDNMDNMNHINNDIHNNNHNNVANTTQSNNAMKKIAKKMEKKRVREQRAAYIQYMEQMKIQREEQQEIERTLREMAYVDKDQEDEDRLRSHKAMEESWRTLVGINKVEYEQQKVNEINVYRNVKQFIDSNQNHEEGLCIHTIAKKFGLSILSVYHLAVKMHEEGEVIFFPASEVLILPASNAEC